MSEKTLNVKFNGKEYSVDVELTGKKYQIMTTSELKLTKVFDCPGDHCGKTIQIPIHSLNDKLWTKISCLHCGRSYILAYNEEEDTKPRGYYLEPVCSY